MTDKRKLLILLLFSIFLISSVSAVCATDSGVNCVQTVDNDEVELEQNNLDNDDSLLIDDSQSCDDEKNLEQSDYNNEVSSTGNTFSDLNTLINSSDSLEIKLEHGYEYHYDTSNPSSDDLSIRINRDNLVIDGDHFFITGPGKIQTRSVCGFIVSSKNVVIKHLNFRDFYSPWLPFPKLDGTAIYCTDSSLNLTLIDCCFFRCSSRNGGAVLNCSVLSGCHFYDCSAFWSGGAISNCGIVDNCEFRSCSARDGGAVSDCDYLKKCTFYDCKASESGGAVFDSNMEYCTIENCRAEAAGGAARISNAVGCKFINNKVTDSDGDGGALLTGKAVNCTFIENSATRNGGALCGANAINCTFKNNHAPYGGAFHSRRSSTIYDVINSTFEDNHADTDYGASYGANLVLCTFNDNNTADNNHLPYEEGAIKTPDILNTGVYNVYEPDSVSIPIKYCYEGVSGKYYFDKISLAVQLCNNDNIIDEMTCLSGSNLTLTLNKGNYSLKNKENNKIISNINVDGLKTVISTQNNVIEMYINENIDLIVRLSDSQNNPIKSCILYFRENGIDLNLSGTDENGQVKFSLKNIPAGVHDNLWVEFLGYDRYARSKLPIHLTVKKYETSLKADNVTKWANEDKGLVVNLTDKDNNPMAGYRILLIENGNLLNVSKTNDEGQVIFSLDNLPAGKHDHIQVLFEENNQYSSSNLVVSIVIKKFATSINADNITKFVSDDVDLVVSLVDESNEPMAGCVIYLKEDGKILNSSTTDENGQVIFSLENLPAGSHNTYIEFLENKYYAGSNLAVSIVIKKFGTVLNADNVSALHDDGKIVARLTDEFGNPLAGCDVCLDLVYIHRTFKTDSNGEVEFDLEGLAEGTYTGEVSFIGNKTHNQSSSKISVKLYRLATEIKVDNIKFVYGESGILTVNLKDSNGSPVENENIELVIGSVHETLKTNSKGQAVIDLSKRLTPGTYQGYVNFDITGKYLRSYSQVNVTVYKIPTQITAPDVDCVFGEEKYLVVTLKDKYDNPIVNKTVSVKLKNNILTGKTDENGQSRFLVDFPPKSYTVAIIYSGDNILQPSSSKVNVVVNRVNDKVSTKIAVYNLKSVYNEGKFLTITLKDDYGNVMGGKNLVINFNGKTKNYKTDKNGQVKLSTSSLIPKKYTAKITFLGDSKYQKSSFDVNLLVKKANPHLFASNKKFKVKSSKNYKVALKTNRNAAMKNVKISLKVKGKTYTVKTDKKGQATFNLKKLTKKGTYKATITYKGNNCYNKIVKTVKITVK